MKTTKAICLWPLALALALTGCGGSGSDNTPGGDNNGDSGLRDGVSEKQLPAADEPVYVNLETGELVGEDDTWHLKASRYTFNLNGGASGSGRVGGALAVAQDDFYTDTGEPDVNIFANATADSELEHLLGPFIEPSEWVTDSLQPAFGSWEQWSSYNHQNGQIDELPDVGYLVRSAEGNSYARMKVINFDFPTREGNGIRDFEFEFTVQAADASAFSDTPVSFTPPEDYDGGDVCFDFDTGQVMDCAPDGLWDVMVGFSGYEWYLRSNSGASGNGGGGASGPVTWEELDAMPSEPGVPQIYSTDSTGGIFSDYSWYAYNLLGEHKLWPNYRTFLIRADVDDPDSSTWSLQVVGYYDENGNSGNPTIRWYPVEFE